MTARKDNRPVVCLRKIDRTFAEALYYAQIIENRLHLSVGCYARRSDAKRGMIRCLRRLGVDPALVRWEAST
jgi:hypothetical protein